MSINIGIKPTVKDGLVLHLDPASPKNYTLSEVEVLVVGGGGGGSYNVYDDGAGGGGGGVLYSSSYKVTPGNGITVTVGNGGAAGNSTGSKGQNSIFGNLIAQGGGGGQGHRSGKHAGANGGSGGGSGGQYSNDSNAPGEGTVGQGHRGGHSISYAGGGGGGAGSPGNGALSWQVGGNGGDGLPFDISGRLRYYGGGGGGYPKTNYNGLGGKGGGGDTYVAGTPNTGGGGGGGKANSASLPIGAPGGSGIVIVRYPGPQKATGGNTIENINGYTIHTFTASGTFTPLNIPVNAGSVYGLQDLSGNSVTTTSINSPTFAGTTNNSLLLNGSNQYLTFGNSFGNDFNEITVSAWVRPTTFPNGNYTAEYLVTSDDGSSGGLNSLFALTIQHHNSPTTIPASFTGNFIAFGVRTKLDPYNFRPISIAQNEIWQQYLGGMAFSKNPPEYALNTWMHLTGTYNGSVTLIYINGVLGGSSDSQPDGVNRSTSGPLNNSLIDRNIGAASGAYSFFAGNIGPVTIHNKALTASQVLQTFNAQRGRFGI